MDQIVTQCKILDFKANSRNEGNEGLQELIEGLRNSSQSVDNGIKNLFSEIKREFHAKTVFLCAV